MTRTVILSAPQGWGKTRFAAQHMREFGCSSIVDGWDPFPSRALYAKKVTSAQLVPGGLHLTHIHPEEIKRRLPGIAGGDQVTIVSRGWGGRRS